MFKRFFVCTALLLLLTGAIFSEEGADISSSVDTTDSASIRSPETVGLTIGIAGQDVNFAADHVGIGTTSPDQKLDVMGRIRANDPGYPDARYIDIYSSMANYITSTNDLYIRPAGGLVLDPTTSTTGGNIELRAASMIPSVDNVTDLGNSSHEFRNLYIDGTAYVDALNMDGNIDMDGYQIQDMACDGGANDAATCGWISSNYYRRQSNSASVTAGNWYRIASNSGNRANAEFTLRDFISGGGHSTLTFRVGISYNYEGGISFTLLNHSYYSTPTFTKVRVLRKSTYDPQYLEVYVQRSGGVEYSIYDNYQSSGWSPVDWTAGSIPSGYTAREFDVNKLFVVGDYDDRFTINRGGNVGIGTTSPGEKLDINGSLDWTEMYWDSGENIKMRGAGEFSFDFADGDGNDYWHVWDPSHSAILAVRNNGRVGIGTTSPGNKLDVAGTGQFDAINMDGNIDLDGYDIVDVDDIYVNDLYDRGTGSMIEVWDEFDMNGNRIEGLGDPNSGDDAMDRDYADNRYVRSSGNYAMTMSANFCYSPDDISGFSTLSGDDYEVNYDIPFDVKIGGTNYGRIVIGCNGGIIFTNSTSAFDISWSNTSLPSSRFSDPFLAPYWDDLVTEGSHIRYGTVGTSPNRTCIVDFECHTYSGSYDVRFQVQIHEGSNLINVKYRDPMDHRANGQYATIGFQMAGGSSAKAYPITYNGKVLDDNRDDSEGWSICPVR